MRTPDFAIDELPEQERLYVSAAVQRMIDSSEAHLADLRAHCDREYPDVAEDPRDLLPYNWRGRLHGVAAANVAHFRR
ncbi:hypothetical protein GCM10019059_07510 [Camelimonas fluminis]|uniref:Uncharacterized protein n=1 Tax=Camelimonas fluminis TaxID=1576911 RepID=A0ABV7UG37_9HYPH|nr:hypothetical protein [Camelimonas fluminis]GHE50887.1 hypothetical protein GCM10019059_07510 [Camelimonas fluminis]